MDIFKFASAYDFPKRTYIIAEAGVNHNGNIDLAKQLVDCAVTAGADAVKFQTFDPSALVTSTGSKADYQIKNTGDDSSQFNMLEALKLSHADFKTLQQYSYVKGIDFISTPFDHKSLQFLVEKLDVPCLKFGSGDLTNAPLLLEAATTDKPIILSTGMADILEIGMALDVLAAGYSKSTPEKIGKFDRKILKGKVILLHCLSDYPAPMDELNLRAITTMQQEFQLPVGYSDHSLGISASLGAISLGACIIEKHVTLDKNLPGPDHVASLTPNEFKNMVTEIRALEVALGDGIKRCMPSEHKTRAIARKGVVAIATIKKGEKFTEQTIAVKRPENGPSPHSFWELQKTHAKKSYKIDDPIT